MVTTLRSPTSAASIMHEATGTRSTQTVQAEHAPRSQPIFVPVRSSGPRKTSASVACPEIATDRCTPFTLRAIVEGAECVPAPVAPAAATLAGAHNPVSNTATPVIAAPVPLRNSRRVIPLVGPFAAILTSFNIAPTIPLARKCALIGIKALICLAHRLHRATLIIVRQFDEHSRTIGAMSQ